MKRGDHAGESGSVCRDRLVARGEWWAVPTLRGALQPECLLHEHPHVERENAIEQRLC